MARASVACACLALVLSGCGGGHPKPAAKKHRKPAPAFRATLVAPTHDPRAGTPWIYAIHVTDPSGRPIRAKVHMQILFAGVPVGQVDNGKTFTFLGTWREPKKAPVIWPARSRGRPLTFEALVTARGQTKKLDYSIRVR